MLITAVDGPTDQTLIPAYATPSIEEGMPVRAARLCVMFFAGILFLASLPSAGAAAPILVRQGLVLPMGSGNAFDSMQAGYPSVLLDHGLYKMWYFGTDPFYFSQIGYATSTDGLNWTKHGAVLSPTLPGEGHDVAYPAVVQNASGFSMWYDGFDGATYRVFAATSPDGVNWTKHGVVVDTGPTGSQDSVYVAYPSVLVRNGAFYMWYTGIDSLTPPNTGIMLATSTDGITWTKIGVVVPRGGNGTPDAFGAFAASVVYQSGAFSMLYTCQATSIDANLCSATSSDGMHWTKDGVVLSPDPPAERTVGQPNVLVLPDGSWDVYYAVRNDVSDIQIFLARTATSQPGGPPGAILGLATTDILILLAVCGIGVVALVAVLFSFRKEPRRPPP